MTTVLKNFVGGAWVEGSGASRNVNPSNTNDVVGEYARASKAQTGEAVAAAKAAFPAWARSTPQVRYDALAKVSAEILARKDELGRLLAREEGKTLPEAVGEVGRAGQIFAFFAGEALRLVGETVPSVRPGDRGRDHARAGRRRRHHHAVEFPDCHSSVEDRAGDLLRQHRGDQAGGTGARHRRMRSPRSSRAPACRLACSTSSWGPARWSARP